MTSIFKWASALMRRAPLKPLQFPTSGFKVIDAAYLVEEENLDEFESNQYFPINIGDVIASTYQIVGKLGFGSTSTVWLARNLLSREHAALKIYARNHGDRQEFRTLELIATANTSHPGYKHVRTGLGILELQRPEGEHFCLVQKPMWESWKELLRRNSDGRFSEPLLKAGLKHLFMALDYLHSECKLVHTDIKADNVLQDIEDPGILKSFTKAELNDPSARKFLPNMTIYASRSFDLPRRFGEPVLSDFGAAVPGDVKRNHDAQPAVYRCPEVMLEAEWSYPADIWNVGAMIWDIFQGRHLFYGNDPNGQGYTTRAHLAEVIGVLGPPPLDLLKRGQRSREFFAEDGKWIADVQIPSNMDLENCVMFIDGKSKDGFMKLVRSMLQWRPEDRKTAKELAQDPWLKSMS